MAAMRETIIMMAPKTNAVRKRQLLVTMSSQSLTQASTKADMSCRSICAAMSKGRSGSCSTESRKRSVRVSPASILLGI